MTTVTHSKVSAKSDGGDSTLILPSDWNADHVVVSGIGVGVLATAVTTCSNATFTRLLWGAEQFDTNGFHDNSTNSGRLTVPSGLGGKYIIACNISWASNTNGERLISLYKNNGEVGYLSRLPASNGLVVSPGVMVQSLADGDYIELFVYQNTGGNLNALVNQGTYDNFSMMRF